MPARFRDQPSGEPREDSGGNLVESGGSSHQQTQQTCNLVTAPHSVAESAPVSLCRDGKRFPVCAHPSHRFDREPPGLQRLGYAIPGKRVQEPSRVTS
jgi:hypothetical protein